MLLLQPFLGQPCLVSPANRHTDKVALSCMLLFSGGMLEPNEQVAAVERFTACIVLWRQACHFCSSSSQFYLLAVAFISRLLLLWSETALCASFSGSVPACCNAGGHIYLLQFLVTSAPTSLMKTEAGRAIALLNRRGASVAAPWQVLAAPRLLQHPIHLRTTELTKSEMYGVWVCEPELTSLVAGARVSSSL